MSVTIYDVAKHAGVSVATVSRVINQSNGVKQETRLNVLNSIETLKFHYNKNAAALKKGKTGVIGLLVPNITNPFYAQVAEGIYSEAMEKETDVFLMITSNDVEHHDFEMVLQKDLDGILAMDMSKSTAERLFNSIENLVLIGNDFLNGQTSCIVTDNYAAIESLLKHLVECGHEKIAMVAEPPEYDDINQRIRAYNSLMDDYGLGKYRYVRQCNGASIQEGEKDGMNWLSEGIEHTAVIATNDMLAIGLMKSLEKNGLQVPKDLSIVGIDGTWVASLVKPALTTVAQPMNEMGKVALNYLLEMLKNEKHAPQKIVLSPTFVEGESVSVLKS